MLLRRVVRNLVSVNRTRFQYFSTAATSQQDTEATDTKAEVKEEVSKESEQLLAQKKLLQEAQQNLMTMEKQQRDLKQKNDELQKNNIDYKEKILRAVAEQSNIINRMKLQEEKIKSFAISQFAKQLLEVSDNLSRALSSVQIDSLQEKQKNSENVSVDQVLKLWEGVDITKNGLYKIFEQFQIQEFNPMKEKFNPNFHEGLYLIDDPELEPLTIGNVLQTGFFIKDRVLRPAKVGYARPKPQEQKKKEEQVEVEKEKQKQ